MMSLLKKIWHLPRHIISDGYDQALQEIIKIIPLKIHRVPSGKKCWTWIVPKKWSAQEGYIKDLKGKTIVDLKDHPLRVHSYSLPVDKTVSKQELLKHIWTNPKRPNAIPFQFKYYEQDWGFCLKQNELKKLTDKKYRVKIASQLANGFLKIGEYTIKGEVEDTIVILAHLCHPAMANDDAAGVAVLVDLAKELKKSKNHYTYKFLLMPETIGSIAFLSQNESLIPKMRYGIFLEMLGGQNTLALQRSRQDHSQIDIIARQIFKENLKKYRVGAFAEIVVNDEMVFNGPGVGVPTISISRYPYPEYHTSDDTIDLITAPQLLEAKAIALKIIKRLDQNYCPKRTFKGPIFLSGYGLWVDWKTNFMLNKNLEQLIINLEGEASIAELAERLDMDFASVHDYLDKFLTKGLITKQYHYDHR